jgi:uncharacterized protein YkwD
VTLCVAATLALGVGAPAHSATADGYGAAAVKATNAVRSARHLHRLRVDACLQRHAAAQAAKMAAQQRMFHQDIRVPLRACHLRMVGENVAVGFGTGRGLVRNGWMKSPPHRANLLRPQFRLVAVAARRGNDGLWYASQLLARR